MSYCNNCNKTIKFSKGIYQYENSCHSALSISKITTWPDGYPKHIWLPQIDEQ